MAESTRQHVLHFGSAVFSSDMVMMLHVATPAICPRTHYRIIRALESVRLGQDVRWRAGKCDSQALRLYTSIEMPLPPTLLSLVITTQSSLTLLSTDTLISFSPFVLTTIIFSPSLLSLAM
ncbi:hypothetical protein KC19_9G172700 [Ceratodon purpureus]|uniref:Uncharacterized protein n=1 Tax=Ceratodon purpureus TaxID=3225 RepID=A0A8T0GX13_CERPU|nr:hypothetical protein KC19_9G172700 [Ceratodon purpureus]